MNITRERVLAFNNEVSKALREMEHPWLDYPSESITDKELKALISASKTLQNHSDSSLINFCEHWRYLALDRIGLQAKKKPEKLLNEVGIMLNSTLWLAFSERVKEQGKTVTITIGCSDDMFSPLMCYPEITKPRSLKGV